MNPWVIIGALVLWAVSLVGVGKWQRHDGAVGEALTCTTGKNAELVAANAKITALNDAARTAERKKAADMAAIGENHDAEKLRLEARRRADVAAARAGALKLRLPASVCPDRGGVPDAGSRPSGGESPTETVELPREVGADLYALVNDADAVTEELNTCWAVVRADRAKT